MCPYCRMRKVDNETWDHCKLCHAIIVLLVYLNEKPKMRVL